MKKFVLTIVFDSMADLMKNHSNNFVRFAQDCQHICGT